MGAHNFMHTCHIFVQGNKQSNQWKDYTWFTQMGTSENDEKSGHIVHFIPMLGPS